MTPAIEARMPGIVDTIPVATASTPTSVEIHRPAPPNTATSAWLTAANEMPATTARPAKANQVPAS